MKSRPPIPDPTKREIRQRCGFGCVVCGCPIYDYHHMIPFAKTHRHVASEITLLCDEHHRQVPKLLTDEQVMKADLKPYNVTHDKSKDFIFNYEGNDFAIELGNNTFVHQNITNGSMLAPIVIRDKIFFNFLVEENELFFNLGLFDENGKIFISIYRNVLKYVPSSAWDIKFVSNRLRLRNKKKTTIFDLEFDIPTKVKFHKLVLNYGEIEVLQVDSDITITDRSNRFKSYIKGGFTFAVRAQPPDPGISISINSPAKGILNYDTKKIVE